MSKLKCSYWDSNTFSLVLFWMKGNTCPLPPNDNGKGEQWADERERGEKAGLEREEKSQSSVIGPDLVLCGLLSPSVIREESKGMEFIKERSSESTCNTGDPGSIPGLGRSPREVIGYPLQYSGLENPMDCIVHGVCSPWGHKESDTTEWLSLSRSSGSQIQSQWEVRAYCHFSWNLWSLVDKRLCSVTRPCLRGVLCISSSELKPRSFLWDKSLTRLSQDIWDVLLFSFSFIKLPEPNGQKNCVV